MKRKRAVSLFFSILIFWSTSTSHAQGFTDIEKNWAKRYIDYFYERNLITGGGNSRFYPESPMKLEDMTVLLYSYLSREHIKVRESDIAEDSVSDDSESKEEDLFSKQTSDPMKQGSEMKEEEFNRAKNDDSITLETERSVENPMEEVHNEDLKDGVLNEDGSDDSVSPQEEEKAVQQIEQWTSETLTARNKEDEIMKEREMEKEGSKTGDISDVAKEGELGLLKEIALDNKFSDQILTRRHMYQLFQNYDSIFERSGIESDKAENYLRMFSEEKNGSLNLTSPNQVINRSEAIKILFDTFEGGELFADHTVELDLPYISQVTPVYAPVGCEPISLLMGLRYRGYAKDVSIRTYLDKVPRDKDDPEIAFAGSPYVPNKNLRTTIFPKPLAEYGKKYGADVINLTGKDTEDLKQELYRGRPVVAYVTLYWRKPYYRSYRIKGEKRTYLRNNHALVLAGYDPSAKKFLVFDPYNVKGIKSKYWVRESTFKELYEVRKHAVAIR